MMIITKRKSENGTRGNEGIIYFSVSIYFKKSYGLKIASFEICPVKVFYCPFTGC